MNILLNGQNYCTDCTNLLQLVAECQLQQKRFAVELNQRIIPKSQLADTTLSEGDRVEIIQAVGGG